MLSKIPEFPHSEVRNTLCPPPTPSIATSHGGLSNFSYDYPRIPPPPVQFLLGELCVVFITARKRSLWRLCFYTCQSVILFTGGHVWWGGHTWRGHAWQGGMHGRGACVGGGHVWQGGHAWHTCPPPDTMRYSQSMRGRYASYWNAFLFILKLIFTARKRSLGQGNIFAPLCHSVHRGGIPACTWVTLYKELHRCWH